MVSHGDRVCPSHPVRSDCTTGWCGPQGRLVGNRPAIMVQAAGSSLQRRQDHPEKKARICVLGAQAVLGRFLSNSVPSTGSSRTATFSAGPALASLSASPRSGSTSSRWPASRGQQHAAQLADPPAPAEKEAMVFFPEGHHAGVGAGGWGLSPGDGLLQFLAEPGHDAGPVGLAAGIQPGHRLQIGRQGHLSSRGARAVCERQPVLSKATGKRSLRFQGEIASVPSQ